MVGVEEQRSRGTALIATPHADVAGDVAQRLSSLGFEPLLAFDGEQAVRGASRQAGVDLVLVDPDLLARVEPDFLSRLRAAAPSPVFVLAPRALAAVGDAENVVADLRPALATTTTEWGGLHLIPRTHEATLDGHSLYLTPIEYRILQILFAAAGALVRRDDLERQVWDTPSLDDGERLGTHIRRIRHKIERTPGAPELLLTVRGLGYRLADPAGNAAAASDTGKAISFPRRHFAG